MKIAIADDELLARVVIRSQLNRLGIENPSIHDAADGEELLAILAREPIDIAFVDIKMPGLDGLETIARCMEVCPATIYYILSGFGQFDYAQQAIRLGVTEYLLKPVAPRQLEEILQTAQARLQKIHQEEQQRLLLAVQAILAGSGEASAYTFLPLAVARDPGPFGEELLGLLGTGPGVFRLHLRHRDCDCVLFCSQYPARLEAVAAELTSPGQPLTLAVGRPCGSEALPAMVEAAVQLLSLRVVDGLGTLYTLPPTDRVPPSHKAEVSAAALELAANFAAGDYVGYHAGISRLLARLDHWPGGIGAAQFRTLQAFLAAALGQDPIGAEDSAGLAGQLSEIGQQLLWGAGEKNEPIQQVVAYLHTHYRESVSIGNLADLFGMSPNYLSTLFKAHIGIGFVKYLTNLRIGEAKRLLLQTQQPVKDIASACGYYSVSHFIKTFVRTEHCTPAEYRTRHASP